MKEKVFVSAIIYAFNDQSTIGNTLKDIDSILYQVYEQYEIILVNDCSSDKTLMFAKETIKEINGNTIIINLARKYGIERAMMAGLNKSMGDFVFEFDSTIIDYPIDIIPKLHKKAMLGYDIVVASSKEISFNSRLFYKFINKMSYLDLDLSTESIRLVSRRALNAMLNLKEKVRYRKALYAFTGFSKGKIVYERKQDVKINKKKLNKENFSLALDIVVSFSNIGLKIAHYLSFLFFIFSIFMAGYAFYNYIFNKNIVEGWTTLMILISMGFAGLFLVVGMLGEYISRILIEIQNRPLYSTRSVDIFKEKENIYNDYITNQIAASKENGG